MERVLLNCYHNRIPLSCLLSKEKIIELSINKDNDLRMCLSSVLAFDETSVTTVSVLTRLSKDPDELVRIEAVDSLGAHICKTSYIALCSASEDEDELVRAFAVYGIALIGKKLSYSSARKLLLEIKQSDKSDYVKVMVYAGLCILGSNEELDYLFKMFGRSDYHINCFVFRALHCLVSISDGCNKSLITRFVLRIDENALLVAEKDAYMELKNALLSTGDGSAC